MGNTNVRAGRRLPRDRRRELSIVFYFIGGFVLIRIWIFLVESESVLVEAVGAVVTFLLLIALLFRYRFLRNREEEEELERQRHLHPEVNDADLVLLRSLFHNPQHGLTQEVIDSLLCFKYSARCKENNGDLITGIVVECPNDVTTNDPVLVATRADIENLNSSRSTPETCCSVCLADYVDGDELMMLPCQHAYHKACVVQWLQRQSQCPLCKQDVLCMLDQTGRLREIATLSGVSLTHIENNNIGHNVPVNDYNTHGSSDANSGTSDSVLHYAGSAPPDTL